VLGACLLIPTLVASILGVNFGIPDHENRSVFIGFLVAISLWGGLAYWALRNARNRDLRMPTWERIAFVTGGLAVGGVGVASGFAASTLWPT
jgi:hypothetical protein